MSDLKQKADAFEREADRRAEKTIHPMNYARIVSQLTHNVDLKREAFTNVKLLARHVLLLDSFFETHCEHYRTAALTTKETLLKRLSSQHGKRFNRLYQKLWGYWEYESSLMKQETFYREDRKRYLQRKSSDVFLYCFVSGISDKRVIRALYCTQQLNDLHDDLVDVKEDREKKTVNVVFLFSREYRSLKDLKPAEQKELLGFAKGLYGHVQKNEQHIPYIVTQAKKHFHSIIRLLDF